jgi:hypothetical protein
MGNDVNPWVRAALMDDAAKRLAARGAGGGDVGLARRELEGAVAELQRGAPKGAQFGTGEALKMETLYPRSAQEMPTKEVSLSELPDEPVEVRGHVFRQVGEPQVRSQTDNFITVTYEDGATLDLHVGDHKILASIHSMDGSLQMLNQNTLPAFEFALQQGEKMGKPVGFGPVSKMDQKTVAVLRGLEKDGRIAFDATQDAAFQRLGTTKVTEEVVEGSRAVWHPDKPWQTTWEMAEAKLKADAVRGGATSVSSGEVLAHKTDWYRSVGEAVEADLPVPTSVIGSARNETLSKLQQMEGHMDGLVESPFQPGALADPKTGEILVTADDALSHRETIDLLRNHLEFWDNSLSKAAARQNPGSLGLVKESARDAELLRKFTGQRPGRPRHAMPLDRVRVHASEPPDIHAGDSPVSGWDGDVVEAVPMGDRWGDTGRQLKVRLDDGTIMDVPESGVDIIRPREHHPAVLERVQKMLDLEDLEFAKGGEYGAMADEMLRLDDRRVAIGRQLSDLGETKPPVAALDEYDRLSKRIDELREGLKRSDEEVAALAVKRNEEAKALRGQLRVAGKDADTPRGSVSAEADEAARSGDLDPSVVVKNEGESPVRAMLQQEAAAKEGWERSVTWGQRGWHDADGRALGPTNPRFVDMADGGKGPDIDNILVRNVDEGKDAGGSGLAPLWRGQRVWEWVTSPQVAFLNRLGLGGEQLSKRWVLSYQNRQRFLDLGRETAAVRNRILRSKTDRYLAGRFLENDFAAIPKGWANEVMTGTSKRALAVQQYLEHYRRATERVADHVQLPQFRRLRDYFAHLSDPKQIVRGLKDDVKAAMLTGNKKRIDMAKRRVKNWRDAELVRLERKDWELGDLPKGVYYGPLEQRLEKMTDYVKDPEMVMRMLEQQSARFHQIDSLVDHYDRLAAATPHAVTAKRIREAKGLLFEPKSNWQQSLDHFLVRNIANPWKGWLHDFIDPNLIDRMSQATRWLGFMMNIGFRPTSALMNLTSIPMHTLLRLGWASPGDLARGTGRFLADQALSGNLVNIGPLAKLKPVIGKNVASDLHELWSERIAGSVPKHWDLPAEHGVDASWIGNAITQTQEAAMEVGGLLFRSTESLNRGASFYAGGYKAYRALDYFREHGTLRRTGDLSEFEFFDGFIAPSRESLEAELKMMRKRVEQWELHEAPGRGEFARGKVDEIAPQGYMGPDETARVRAILNGPGDDFDKATRLFDPERRIKEAVEQDEVQRFVGDVATEVTDETQFIYTKQNRPVGIVRNNAWAGTVFQFFDFMRSQLEFLGQKLPFIIRRGSSKDLFGAGSKASRLPGPGFAFLGMLWAIGGPRAMPFIEFITSAAGVGNPDWDDELEELLGVVRDYRPGKGQKWLNDGDGVPTNLATLGVSLANRIRPGFNPPRSSEPYAGASAFARGAASFGGAFIEPIAKAVGSVWSASDIADVGREVHGMEPGLAAAAAVEGRSGGLNLRTDRVDPEKLHFMGLPLGKVVEEPWSEAGGGGWGQWAANIPSQAAKTAGMETLGAALEVKPGSAPGTISLPGDNLSGLVGALRESIQGAVRGEGVTKRRDKLVTPIGGLAARASEWFGVQAEKEQDIRREARRMAKKAKGIDEAGLALLDYKIKFHRRPDGTKPSILDLSEEMARHSFFMKPSDIHNRIISKEHSLYTRQVSQLSKQANKYLAEKENLFERLDEEIETLDRAGLQMATHGAKAQYTASARKFWSQVSDEIALGDGRWTMEMRDELLLDVKKTHDPKLASVLTQALANWKVGKKGRRSIEIDKDMQNLHAMVFRRMKGRSTEDRVKVMERKFRDLYKLDAAKYHKMMELGLWMIDQTGVASDPPVPSPEAQQETMRSGGHLYPASEEKARSGGLAWFEGLDGNRVLINSELELEALVKAGVEVRGSKWSPEARRIIARLQAKDPEMAARVEELLREEEEQGR